jgi:hypothetical protein
MLMQQKVKEWKEYESEKQKLLQYLKDAEKELEKPPATTGQDLAEKDFKSKKVNLDILSVGELSLIVSCLFCLLFNLPELK